MGKIHLEKISLYAKHGCLEEEEKIGSEYLVDLTVETDLELSSNSDNLADTVDYVHLNLIVKEEMAIRSKLLEHVCQRILTRIKTELPKVLSAKVILTKVNPPIGGNVKGVKVEMHF
ncbi:MAG: dihydroneopterin aldolase [Flavobacteriaceae bacterium]|nr:MAG: dihydroneopterin aldolase [Flavobacteriaceae bacterium]